MITEELAATSPVCLGTTLGKPLLQLRFGHASIAVAGKSNEDFYGIVTAQEEPEAQTRGVAAAIADGVSGSGGGRLASETTVRSLLRDFYGAPVRWNFAATVDKVLRSINDWLAAENSRNPELEGVVSTLTMMLFKDNNYYLAHVGDSRAYRKRGRVLKQLTIDHTWQRGDMRHVLKRAVGLDTHLVVDCSDGELMPGDVFVMATDGVWEVLGERVVREVLDAGGDVQAIANELVKRSIRNQVQYMGRNDATALVVAVEQSERQG
ncbi:MAG TPA: PP2C family serine/threonine-protein phosphatase [Burkholderiales bacterium]|jgi:protein phosphatase|nr:PP2C family serine/threonine-protein phosphatase [Burkholderiales bacterium]